MAYFANGSGGAVLDEQCSNCILGEKECPIICAQMEFNYDQIGNKDLMACLNMLVNKKGRCQLKPLLKQSEKQDEDATKSLHPDLFKEAVMPESVSE